MKNNNVEDISYKQAIEELEQIVNEIESGELDLDELLKKVERSAALLLYCKEKLKNSETKLNQVIKKLESDEE